MTSERSFAYTVPLGRVPIHQSSIPHSFTIVPPTLSWIIRPSLLADLMVEHGVVANDRSFIDRQHGSNSKQYARSYYSKRKFCFVFFRFKKGRIMLLGSLAAWIIFNVPIGFIKPPATSCLVFNSSGFFIETPKGMINRISKRSIAQSDADYYLTDFQQENLIDAGWTPRPWMEDFVDHSGDTSTDALIASKLPWNQLMAMEEEESVDIPLADYGNDDPRLVRVRRNTPSPMKPTHEVGMSPYTLEFAKNYKESANNQWVSPTFSYTIFNRNDIRKVFFLFLLLIVIGEFFCCPSMTLADSAVLNLLGKENADQYGRQRMFASIGWGLTMFFVCLTLDHSHSFTNHPCQVPNCFFVRLLI